MRPALLPTLLSFSTLSLTGCIATPLAHPLRAHDGFTAEASGTVGLFAGDVREKTDTGYNESSGTGWGAVSGSIGYAHVFAERIGAMAGFYGPAGANEHNKSWLSSVAAYSFFTWQHPVLSVGIGPEVGYGGFATTMGFELGPFAGVHGGAYARWFWPFVPAGNYTDDHRSHEFGFRLRRGMLYGQYGFYQQVNGLNEFDVFGTTYSAHAYHQLTLGLLFDASTVR
jgi:hypothetical protein